MAAQILDGKALAKRLQEAIRVRVADHMAQQHALPTLAAVLVGDDPASAVYVRNKQSACRRVGINSQLWRLPANVSTEQVAEQVAVLNDDPAVHGILVQLPLPPAVDCAKSSI